MLDECWRRIDAGISFTGMGFPYLPDLAEALPWVSGLGTAATALVGVAWLTLVLGMRWQLKTKVVAALPGRPAATPPGIPASSSRASEC